MRTIKITVLLAVLLSMVGAKAFAHDIEVPNDDGVTIYYNFINDNTELEVTYKGNNPYSYKNVSRTIVIPESITYNGQVYKVTSIGKQAFKSHDNYNDSCEKVEVTDALAGLFSPAPYLSSVTIPNSVTTIGDEAFFYCVHLDSVTIPNSVVTIGNKAFYRCHKLTSLTIPNSVTNIGDEAFYGCHRFTSVDIESGVIGQSAFSECSELTSVLIGSSVTAIGTEAFEDCSSLKEVHISDLDAWCRIGFEGYGSNPLRYAHHLYLYDEKIKDLIIPNNVTSIGSFAFAGCSSLTSVTIPNSVTSIGSYAFDGCI